MNRNGMVAGLGLAIAIALGGCGMMDRAGDKMAASMSGGERVSLSGAGEVPPVQTSASGSGTVTVGADRSVKVDIKVSGMQATAAHIHEGESGANGPVIVPLQKKGENEFVSADGAKLTDAQYDAYKAGRTYLNVHSEKNKGGEIRAQLKGH